MPEHRQTWECAADVPGAEIVAVWAAPSFFKPWWERSHLRQAALSRGHLRVAPDGNEQPRLAENKLCLIEDGKLKIFGWQKSSDERFTLLLAYISSLLTFFLVLFNLKTASVSFLGECLCLALCWMPSTC